MIYRPRQTPAGRFGEADELMGTALLLASDTAGAFITGANVAIYGGLFSKTL